MTMQIAEYNATAAALADLKGRFGGVIYDVTTPKGMKDAIEGRRELRTLRVDLEKMRKEIKAPALERSRLIDAEAKTITAQIVELEEPIDGQIKAEEARKAAEKAEVERIERERVEVIRQKIEAIRSAPHGLIGRPVAEIESATRDAMALDLSAFVGADFDAASAAQIEAVDRLEAMAEQARKDAAEAARIAEERRVELQRIADERAELAKLRAAEEARAADAKAKADAERAEADRVAAIERKRLDDERAAADAKARAEREEEDRKAAAERKRLADEQAAEAARIAAERAEADRIAREKAEADAARVRAEQEAEAARLKAERDAIEKARREHLAVERQRIIDGATLASAAVDAVALLRELGEGDHVVTLTLAAAIERDAS